MRKPTATNQWAAPTTPHLAIRVWATNSFVSVFERATGSLVRLPAGAGWPSRMTREICATARLNRATPTAVRISTKMIAASCMGAPRACASENILSGNLLRSRLRVPGNGGLMKPRRW